MSPVALPRASSAPGILAIKTYFREQSKLVYWRFFRTFNVNAGLATLPQASELREDVLSISCAPETCATNICTQKLLTNKIDAPIHD